MVEAAVPGRKRTNNEVLGGQNNKIMGMLCYYTGLMESNKNFIGEGGRVD